MKLTPWFDCTTQPPVRSGWYDVKFSGTRGYTRLWWRDDYWTVTPDDWYVFSEGVFHGAKWRGRLQ